MLQIAGSRHIPPVPPEFAMVVNHANAPGIRCSAWGSRGLCGALSHSSRLKGIQTSFKLTNEGLYISLSLYDVLSWVETSDDVADEHDDEELKSCGGYSGISRQQLHVDGLHDVVVDIISDVMHSG